MAIKKHLLSLQEVNDEDILELINHASLIKKNPKKHCSSLSHKTMLMLFEKPSLRTRVSFDVAMNQLGGHAIFMETRNATFKQKESISDTAKASSRYCDIIMARLFKQDDIGELAASSDVPVINGLTDTFHPCQILSDMLTIYEKKNKIKGLKLAFVGDGNNNIAHDLLLGCSAAGIHISVGCPKELMPQEWIVKIANDKSDKNGSEVEIFNNAEEAVKNADIVYADTWMSYHIPKEEQDARIKILTPFQIDKKIMSTAKDDAIFMNCLPAMRGFEQTAEIIDGPQSVVFDQAENRLHMQKAIILKLLGKI